MPQTGVATEMRTLLERAPDGVCVTTSGEVVFWNRAAERLLGYRARDVLGRSSGEILMAEPAAGEPPGAQPWQLPRPNGFDHTFEIRTRGRSGRPVWLDVTAFSADDGGPVPVVVYVFRDITRGKELLRQLHERFGLHRQDRRLTPREREVLGAIAAGLSTGAVAERLRVSRATVRNHAQNIFGKLGVHTRLEAVMLATRERLL
jgi:PAS domain S-box-containing protein